MTHVNRISLFIALASTLTLGLAAHAAAPQVKTQAPGYYRTMVGHIEVTTLFDGFFPMEPKKMLAHPNSKTNDLLVKSYQSSESLPTSVNGFLVNTGTKLILIDTGCGAFYGPSLGHLVENLKAAGYTPDQVDEIEITHMHTDHLGGIVTDGKAAFPNAILRIDQHDVDYWLNTDNEKGVSDQMKSNFTNAMAAVAPYKAAGRLKPFNGQTDITTGVTAIPEYGHTPGHTVYQIESNGAKLLLVGDTLHIEAIQFPDPSASLSFDSDEKKALAVRKSIFEDAATKGFMIGAAHLPFPGLGHVAKVGKGSYRYLPLPYGPVQ
jgi:glyoxylase-like metal-dependent hydrolase (beta-lactamase superfamily II)